MCKISKCITALKKDLADANRDVNLDEDIHLRVNAISLDHGIDHLEKKRYKAAYDKAQAHWFMKGEHINKYWSKVNNPRTPQDLIYRLVHPNTQEIITRLDKMAELT